MYSQHNLRFGGWTAGATALSAAILAASAVPALAQTAPTTQQLEDQIQALQQQLNAIKAAPPPAPQASSAPSLPAADGSLTLYGVTLYGTIDVGVAYQTHGAPLSDTAIFGLDYLVQKNGNKGLFSIAPNGLQQSRIGLKGTEDLFDGVSAVFKLETGFQPTSGMLADGPGSVARNDGVALNNQTTAGDSSRAGQAFNGEAYVGLKSDRFGTVTIGRNNSLMLDGVNAYDPMGGSYAFSVIGFSGTTAGAGDTQDARLDQSVKYILPIGPARIEGIYSFGGTDGEARSAYEFDIGADYAGFSVDALYNHVNDAISVSALSSYSEKVGKETITLPFDSLSATISDDTSWALLAKYVTGPVKLYGGYERIQFDNPSVALPAGTIDLGGYDLSLVSNTAYTNNKVLQVFWGGVKYSLLPEMDITGAYYHYDQNSFKGNGCSNSSSSACEGTLDAVSAMLDYRFSKRLDAYGGAMFSNVAGGLANGYLNSTNISPMIGGRFSF